jgi:membrane protease YdiL (CAAX protease family)
MKSKSSSVIKRHPVVFFYVLAFGITWLGWIPQTLHSYGLFPFDHPLLGFLGAAGPTLAAVITIWVLEGRDGPRELFAPLFNWQVSWPWYLLVFLFWFGVAALALGAGTLFGQRFPAINRFAWASLLPIFISMLLSNVWEEFGWRGFALPRLQERYSDLTIALLMGSLWSLWHLPTLLDPASPMSDLPILGEILFSLALTVIYIWLYNNTQGSLLFVTLFHAMSNTIAFVLLELGVFVSSYLFVVGVTSIVAVLIVLLHGAGRFSRSGSSGGSGS